MHAHYHHECAFTQCFPKLHKHILTFFSLHYYFSVPVWPNSNLHQQGVFPWGQ